MDVKLVRAQRAYTTVLRSGLQKGLNQEDAEVLAALAFRSAALQEKGAKVLRSAPSPGNADGWEQVVMCEMLIPDVPNSWGDLYSREAVRDFAYEFARQGYIIDVEHDNVDVQGTQAIVVESFIARPGDPDFIEGAWVVGMKILDDALWARILAGEINGYSFEADVMMTQVVFQNLRNRQVSGTTEPDPVDGHTHSYLVLLNAFNKPISGGTGVTDGHSHKISTHTVTGVASDLSGRSHSHRYQVIQTP